MVGNTQPVTDLSPLELEMLFTLDNGPETSATVHPDFFRPSNSFSDEARQLSRADLEAIYRRFLELGYVSATHHDHDGYAPAPEDHLVPWYSLTAKGEELLDAYDG